MRLQGALGVLEGSRPWGAECCTLPLLHAINWSRKDVIFSTSLNAISASGLACTFFVVPLEQASFRSALRQAENASSNRAGREIANLRRELRCTTGLDPSSALFGSLREKRLELRHNLGAVAVRALHALLFVLTDHHRKVETLATLLAKIFVERHINPCYYRILFSFVS